MSAQRWVTLPCGRSPAALLDLVANGVPPSPVTHEATCPYCQAAISELADLWQPVTQWTTRSVQVPRGFLNDVVERVRRLVQSPHHIAVTTARGATTVTSWVLGLLATGATQDTPGVTRITGTPPSPSRHPSRRRQVRYGSDGVEIDEIGATQVAVTFGITAHPVDDLADLADQIRRNVIAAISDTTTIGVARVDISIDDLDDLDDP